MSEISKLCQSHEYDCKFPKEVFRKKYNLEGLLDCEGCDKSNMTLRGPRSALFPKIFNLKLY